LNLLENPTPAQISIFTWAHEPKHWEPLAGGGLRILVPSCVDYFQDPAGKLSADSAPFLWMRWEGDFVAQAHVRHAFQSTYDAGALLIRQDAQHWAKLCFEATDFGSRAVVSVVTNGISDDANGVDVGVSDIWLQVTRFGNLFAMHYALNGHDWRMVRYFPLALTAEVKIGLVAQCPVGKGATIDWLALNVERRTLNNMRAGK
jgi:uncharacterized protein